MIKKHRERERERMRRRKKKRIVKRTIVSFVKKASFLIMHIDTFIFFLIFHNSFFLRQKFHEGASICIYIIFLSCQTNSNGSF